MGGNSKNIKMKFYGRRMVAGLNKIIDEEL
jgi:hypothetical protein